MFPNLKLPFSTVTSSREYTICPELSVYLTWCRVSLSQKHQCRFNVYVTQPEVKPGCVLRRSNYNVLENRKLVSRDETDMCKKGMNTFAYVGDLEGSPEVSCVYHSEQAENQYLVNPSLARMGDGRRPLDAPPTEVP